LAGTATVHVRMTASSLCQLRSTEDISTDDFPLQTFKWEVIVVGKFEVEKNVRNNAQKS
jgi:hypothetical protein